MVLFVLGIYRTKSENIVVPFLNVTWYLLCLFVSIYFPFLRNAINLIF